MGERVAFGVFLEAPAAGVIRNDHEGVWVASDLLLFRVSMPSGSLSALHNMTYTS